MNYARRSPGGLFLFGGRCAAHLAYVLGGISRPYSLAGGANAGSLYG